jgi:hypothetical protein
MQAFYATELPCSVLCHVGKATFSATKLPLVCFTILVKPRLGPTTTNYAVKLAVPRIFLLNKIWYITYIENDQISQL